MAISQDTQSVSLHLKGMVVSNGSLRVIRKHQITQQRRSYIIRSHRARKILMKRRPMRLEGSRRSANNVVQRRVKTLKKLIPNTETMSLDGLFKETLDYISSLQRRVEAMKVLVKILTGSSDEQLISHL